MKPIIIHPAALAEAMDQEDYYEDRQEGLGVEFQAVLAADLDRIQRNPAAVKRWDGPYQKLFMKRFPFAVIFRERTDAIRVIAIKHHSRDPDYWKHRITNET